MMSLGNDFVSGPITAKGVSVAVQHGMTDRQEFQRCTGELSEGPGDDGEGVPGRSRALHLCVCVCVKANERAGAREADRGAESSSPNLLLISSRWRLRAVSPQQPIKQHGAFSSLLLERSGPLSVNFND